MIRAIVATFILALLPAPGLAAPHGQGELPRGGASPDAGLQSAAAPRTAAEIEACVRANLPRESSIQTVVFRSTDRVGSVTRSEADLYWKRFDDDLSKALLRFQAPANMRGAGVLLLENRGRRPDTFMYLPELRAVRRVSSRAASNSLFGTDFSYEDFERLMGMSADARRERLPDEEIAGREVFVVAGYPDEEAGSSYERVTSWVDKQTCVPLRSESYEHGDVLRKRLVADVGQITREGNRYIPRSQIMRDLRDETQTELMVQSIQLDAKIHRKVFSERELAAGGH